MGPLTVTNQILSYRFHHWSFIPEFPEQRTRTPMLLSRAQCLLSKVQIGWNAFSYTTVTGFNHKWSSKKLFKTVLLCKPGQLQIQWQTSLMMMQTLGRAGKDWNNTAAATQIFLQHYKSAGWLDSSSVQRQKGKACGISCLNVEQGAAPGSFCSTGCARENLRLWRSRRDGLWQNWFVRIYVPGLDGSSKKWSLQRLFLGICIVASKRILADLTICLNPVCPLGPDRCISQDDPGGVMEMSGRGLWLGMKDTQCYCYSLENPVKLLG